MRSRSVTCGREPGPCSAAVRRGQGSSQTHPPPRRAGGSQLCGRWSAGEGTRGPGRQDDVRGLKGKESQSHPQTRTPGQQALRHVSPEGKLRPTSQGRQGPDRQKPAPVAEPTPAATSKLSISPGCGCPGKGGCLRPREVPPVPLTLPGAGISPQSPGHLPNSLSPGPPLSGRASTTAGLRER